MQVRSPGESSGRRFVTGRRPGCGGAAQNVPKVPKLYPAENGVQRSAALRFIQQQKHHIMNSSIATRFSGSVGGATVCRGCRLTAIRSSYQFPRTQHTASIGSLPRPRSNAKTNQKHAAHRQLPQYAASFTRNKSSSAKASSLNYDPKALLKEVQQQIDAIEQSVAAPSEEDVMKILEESLILAELLSQEPTKSKPAKTPEQSATLSLLDLVEEQELPGQISGTTKQQISTQIPIAITTLLNDPKVFISPEILERYVQVQCLFQRPEWFPEIFTLYSEKPIPLQGTNPVKYKKASPKSHKNAIEPKVAEMALDCAISKKDLSLILAIIDKTYCSPAFYRSKILRKAGVPLTGLAIAPGAAYGIASAIAQVQDSMEPGMATGIATAGILTYICGTAAIGGLAVTTANDQMERVVWAPGQPLRYRWLREEERAALDKIANAWGFKEEWRRGEEEGEEWQNLKEFVGLRGMILDKTDLMEGME